MSDKNQNTVIKPHSRPLRNTLSEDKFGNKEILDIDMGCREIIHSIYGELKGVLIVTRAIVEEDTHLCLMPITRDEGRWFASSSHSFSSHWLEDSLRVLEAAKIWLEENADPDVHNGIQYGYIRRGR